MNEKGINLAGYYKQKYPLTFVKNGTVGDPLLAKRYDSAWRLAREIALILKEKYNAKKWWYLALFLKYGLFSNV